MLAIEKKGEKMNSRVVRLLSLFAVYVSLSTPAHAYLDGATASIVLQAIIGGVTTWLVYSRSMVSKAKVFLSGLTGRSQSKGAE